MCSQTTSLLGPRMFATGDQANSSNHASMAGGSSNNCGKRGALNHSAANLNTSACAQRRWGL